MRTERLTHLILVSSLTPFLWVTAHAYAQPAASNPSDKCLELGFSKGSEEYEECLVMLSPVVLSAGPTNVPPSPTASRLAGVQAITRPETEDAGDDEYTYGLLLWEAGYFPEARQQLSLFLEKYPSHWRASFGRNLLGRAFLDDGKAREAAYWFLQNYQLDIQGARGADSLLHLAESMVALKDTPRACIALREFIDTYPLLVAGRLRDQYESVRRMAGCV